MWDQRNSKYAAAVGIQLLSKIHRLKLQLRYVGRLQNHLVDCCNKHIDFIGDAADRVGLVVDKLNDQINLQDVQVEQLANMVNNLIGKVEGQSKEIKILKANREFHRKVINTMTAKVIALEQCVEDVQRKVFPQVGGKWPSLIIADPFLLSDSHSSP